MFPPTDDDAWMSMRSRTERDLEALRKMVLAHLRPWRVRVWLFGSRARGDAAPGSDVDIAVWPEEDVPPDWLAPLREALEESCLPWEVDIVDLREASEAVRQAVAREGVPWND